jgi:hypothetical protein
MKSKEVIPQNPHPAHNANEQNGNGLLFSPKYNITNASKMLSISESKLREFIKSGEIPVIKIEGKYLLLEGDLESFLVDRYGTLKPSTFKSSGITPLPSNIAESEFLRKAG